MGGVEVMSELLQCYGEHKAVTQLGETWGKLGQRAVAKVQSGQLKDAGLQQKCRLGIGVGPEKMVQSSAEFENLFRQKTLRAGRFRQVRKLCSLKLEQIRAMDFSSFARTWQVYLYWSHRHESKTSEEWRNGFEGCGVYICTLW